MEENEKCTKYFFDLEKSNYVKKHIRKLKIDDNTEVTEADKILEYERLFYKELYTEYIENETVLSSDLLVQEMIKLTNNQKESCEGVVEKDECFKILKTFKNNKSPGNDGLTMEFYLKFWNAICNLLIDSYNESFDKGVLSVSQRQAIITLLQKKDKDKLLLKNWRPISLLNLDYKILTKVLATRMKKVLPFVIHHNQTGFIEGRRIVDSIRIIQDIMNYTKNNNLGGMLLFIDFEKAFDSINWTFMLQALKCLNFGPNFIKWVKVFYTDISSCIINNGSTCEYFPVSRGVRQGDPLSPYLFIVVTEFLASRIRANNNIKGFTVNKNNIKLTMYADDTTAFIADEKSAKCLFVELDNFKKVSGLKINIEKTEGLWLGSNIHSQKKPFGIKWSKEPIKALGIYYSYDKQSAERANFDDKIKKLEMMLHWWKARNLTLMGRVLIVKTLGVSQFSFLASVLHIPESVIKKVNTCIFHYIWKGKTDKVKRDIMIQDYKDGGYKMVDFKMIVESGKIDWIKRFLSNISADWKILMFAFCKKENLSLFFQGNFDENEIPQDIPEYYIEAIRTWRNIKYDNIVEESDIHQQLIWYNKSIKVNNKSVYNQRLFTSGLWVLSDLYEDGKLIPFNIWVKRGANPNDFLNWMGLVNSLPQYIRNMAKVVNNLDKPNFTTRIFTVNKQFKSIEECQQRDIKDIIRMTKLSSLTVNDFKAKNKYAIQFNNIDTLTWEKIFSLPIAVNCNNKLKDLQFKILHRIFPSYQFLYKVKKVESPKCVFCEIYDESLEHLFANCAIIKTFWLRMLTLWNVFQGSALKLCNKDILLGFDIEDPAKSYTLNLLILYGKMFIVRCRMEKLDLNVHMFIRYVMSHYAFRLEPHLRGKLQTYEIELTEFCSNYEV